MRGDSVGLLGLDSRVCCCYTSECTHRTPGGVLGSLAKMQSADGLFREMNK